MAIETAMLVGAALIVHNSSFASQIMGVAMARFVTGTFIVTPIFVYILMRMCKISFRDFILVVAPSSISAASVVVAVFLFGSSGWLRSTRPAVVLGAEVAVGGAVGLIVLLALETQLRKSVTALLQRNLYRLMLAKQPV